TGSDRGVRERPGTPARPAARVGAGLGEGESHRVVVCHRPQPAAGGEPARGARQLGGGERPARSSKALRTWATAAASGAQAERRTGSQRQAQKQRKPAPFVSFPWRMVKPISSQPLSTEYRLLGTCPQP